MKFPYSRRGSYAIYHLAELMSEVTLTVATSTLFYFSISAHLRNGSSNVGVFATYLVFYLIFFLLLELAWTR